MKRILFLNSHFGSGYEALYEILNSHPLIDGVFTIDAFDHPLKARNLTLYNKHKDDTSQAIYLCPILMNIMLCHKKLFEIGNFIYFIRPPLYSLHEMVDCGAYTPIGALNYYIFRLRKLAYMAKHTPNAPILTWDMISKKQGLEKIQKYLNLKTEFKFKYFEPRPISNSIHRSYIDKAQEAYDKCFKYLNKINL